MKIGYNEATAMKKSDLINDLILAEKYGYDYIEIRLDMLKDYFDRHEIVDLKSFFSESNVKPYALNAIEEINFRKGASLAKLKEDVEKACEIAEQIGNPYLIVVPSFRDESAIGKSGKEIEEDSIEVLNRLADIGDRHNVKIAFEPVGFKSCAVRSMGQAWEIVRKTDRASVGLVIDAFNVYIFDRLSDMDVLNTIPAEKIFVFHINDCEGQVPLDAVALNHRVWPGDGVIPLERMLHILYEKGFDRIASVELFREEYWAMEPETVFRTGMEKTKKQILINYK
jgi:2-keto-myo-inositol isomerase